MMSFDRDWLEDFLSTASDYADEHEVILAVNEYGVSTLGNGRG